MYFRRALLSLSLCFIHTDTHTHDHPVVCTRTSTFSSISFLTLNTLTHRQINIEVFMCMLMYIIHCVNLPLSVASLIFFLLFYCSHSPLIWFAISFHFILEVQVYRIRCIFPNLSFIHVWLPSCSHLHYIGYAFVVFISSFMFFFLLLFFSHSLLLVYCFTGWNIPFAADAHNMPIKMDTMIFKCYK